MSMAESRTDAVAQVYARSLFELAEGEGGQERAEAVLGELEEIVEVTRANASFSEFMSSRVIGTAPRSASLKKIFEGRASDLVVRFLLVLNEKGRLSHLESIVGAYDALVQERFGRLEVDVFTPTPASPEALSTIRERLAQQLGKEIVLHPYTDAKMIGGLKLRIGDQLIDGSVETRLRRMRERLAREGADRVRASARDFLAEE